jgi:hypothetical protein
MRATAGDWIVVQSLHTGEVEREGQIVEVHGEDGAPPYVVRWTDDDHESLMFPGPDAHIVQHPPHERAPDSTG